MQAVKTRSAPTRRLANKAEVAEFFEIHISTLDAWIRRGCPSIQRGGKGRAWEFDLLEVARWRFSGTDDQEDDPEKMSPKERLDYYKGCRERDTYRQESGELLHVDEVVKQWTGLVRVAKGRLLSLPSRLSPELVSMQDIRGIEDRIKAELTQVLEELAGEHGST